MSADSNALRSRVLSEIKRMAAGSRKAPGKLAFARHTGTAEHEWSGVLWSRWSDAVAEAGLEPNALQARFKTNDVLSQVIRACRHYGHVPTVAEMKLYRRDNPNFPSKGAVASHFESRAGLLTALDRHADQKEEFRDVAGMVAAATLAEPGAQFAPTGQDAAERIAEGHVYLLKSGHHYKVGRSDELERRVKEVRLALPEAVTLVHAIRTDDPPGIEAYWHRRFADRRANGEWFKLSAPDVAAFKRRKYQ